MLFFLTASAVAAADVAPAIVCVLFLYLLSLFYECQKLSQDSGKKFNLLCFALFVQQA